MVIKMTLFAIIIVLLIIMGVILNKLSTSFKEEDKMGLKTCDEVIKSFEAELKELSIEVEKGVTDSQKKLEHCKLELERFKKIRDKIK